MNKNVLIYLEHNNGVVERVSKEIISEVHSCFENVDVSGVLLCDENSYNSLKLELSSLNLKHITVIKDNLFDVFNTCIFASALTKFIAETIPDVFLMGATSDGRDLAPRVASKLNIGLTADCTSLNLDENGTLLATRPTYGGKMMATIVSKTLPNFATVRAGAFKLKNMPESPCPHIIECDSELTCTESLIEVLNCEKKPHVDDWACSEIIVSGGLGLGCKENFDLIYKLADKLGAKPAASRAAVEQGWAPQSIQVGQTGVSVAPKLYLAFGISGAMQHMVGITNSDRIIAINTNPEAPIMKAADTAVVNDAVSVLQELLAK